MTIRKITTDDAASLIDFFRTLVKEDPERVETVEDAQKITLEKEVAWIENIQAKEVQREQFSLCAEEDEKIVGEGEVEKMKRQINRHVAEIRFGILPEYGHLALEMVKQLENLAKENGVEVLVYFHLSSQKTGLAIMREAGFAQSGVIEKYYKRGGGYVDRVYMNKTLVA